MANFKVYVLNCGSATNGYHRGAWIQLPMDSVHLRAAMSEIGATESYGEYFIADYESIFVGLKINEYARIEELNELAQQIEKLGDADTEKLAAILESEIPCSVTAIIELIEQIDCFDLYRGVENEQQLGLYFAEMGAFNDVPTHFRSYIDYSAWGHDYHLSSCGIFTSMGYLADNR